MAVYTEVSDEALAAFLEPYGVGALMSFKGIAEGVENTNYLVRAEKGPFILTLYEKRVRKDDLPWFLDLMEHLARSGIATARPVRDRDGLALRELCGRPAALVEFLDGVWVRRPGVAHCAALGEALARLHLAGRDFPRRRANDLTVTGWRPLFARFGDKADAIAPGLASEIDRELSDLEGRWPDGLPEGVIHADLFPDNVFFLGDRLSGLIDFYFACTDALAYDVAVCLNAWCFEPDASFNVTKGRALLRAYAAHRPFAPEEIEALPLLARGAAMRFLLTRSHDWLHTPKDALVRPKDPLQFLRRLRFHMNVASARDYGLEAV
jgi:homoserine kinase type II